MHIQHTVAPVPSEAPSSSTARPHWDQLCLADLRYAGKLADEIVRSEVGRLAGLNKDDVLTWFGDVTFASEVFEHAFRFCVHNAVQLHRNFPDSISITRMARGVCSLMATVLSILCEPLPAPNDARRPRIYETAQALLEFEERVGAEEVKLGSSLALARSIQSMKAHVLDPLLAMFELGLRKVTLWKSHSMALVEARKSRVPSSSRGVQAAWLGVGAARKSQETVAERVCVLFTVHFSLRVKRCRENDVPLDEGRSLVHLLIQDWVSYDASSVFHVPKNFVQTLNCPNDHPFLLK